MSLILPSRRSIIKALFIAPAIVASTNIMPVKAYDLLTTASISNDWALIEFIQPSGDNLTRWVKRNLVEFVAYDHRIVRYKEMPITPNMIDTTVGLMKTTPAAVIWELPDSAMKHFEVRGRTESSYKWERSKFTHTPGCHNPLDEEVRIINSIVKG